MFKTKKLKRHLEIGLLISLLIMTITWTYFIKIRHIKSYWIKIEPSKNITPKKITFYKQNDPEWEKVKMWDTELSVGWYGCLLSVMATSLCDLGYKFTPKKLNDIFSSGDIYNDNGEIVWYKINTVIPEVDYKYKRIFGSSTIEKALEDNLLPMVKVKYRKKGVFHWVLVVWADRWDFIIVDPLAPNKNLIKLDEHWQVYAYRVLVNKKVEKLVQR